MSIQFRFSYERKIMKWNGIVWHIRLWRHLTTVSSAARALAVCRKTLYYLSSVTIGKHTFVNVKALHYSRFISAKRFVFICPFAGSEGNCNFRLLHDVSNKPKQNLLYRGDVKLRNSFEYSSLILSQPCRALSFSHLIYHRWTAGVMLTYCVRLFL